MLPSTFYFCLARRTFPVLAALLGLVLPTAAARADALDDFRAADTVVIGSVTELIEISGVPGAPPPQSSSARDITLPKTPGQLDLTLNPRRMGFGELNLDIPLRGEVGRDRSRIVWRANMVMPSGTGPRVNGLRIHSITATLEMRLTTISPPRTEETAASLRTFRTRLAIPEGTAAEGHQIRLVFEVGVNANLTLTALDASAGVTEAPVQLDSISLTSDRLSLAPGQSGSGYATILLNRAPTGDLVYTVNLSSSNSALRLDPAPIHFRAGIRERTVPWTFTAGPYGTFTVTAEGRWGNETRRTTQRGTLRVTNRQAPAEQFPVLLNYRDLEFTRPPVGCFLPEARLAEGIRPNELPKRALPGVDPKILQPGIEKRGQPSDKTPAKAGTGGDKVNGKPALPGPDKAGQPAGKNPGKANSGSDGADGFRPILHPPSKPEDAKNAKPALAAPNPKNAKPATAIDTKETPKR
jgi:hypothetical protein